MSPRICVIGAGASGLTATKICLEYNFQVMCLEKSIDIGGLWRYKPHPCAPGEGTVMKSTVINSSKELTAFSDFVPPPEMPNFMSHVQMLAYLRLYAKHFDLLRHIHLKHEVLAIERNEKYDENGQWNVTYRNINNDMVNTEIFDGVLLCCGHHTIPHWPQPFLGQDRFHGEIIHSHDYREPLAYSGKNIVVVGFGNSAGDIAVDVSEIADEVYLSTRTGAWVLGRTWDRGEPADAVFISRYIQTIRNMVPFWVLNKAIENQINQRFDHGRFGLTPKHGPLEAHNTVNDCLPSRLASGTIIIKPNIARFTERDVIFEDGTAATNVDLVIFCTGYSFHFSIVENGNLIPVIDNEVNLYLYMYPPHLSSKNTLAVIGLIQPMGSILPISEMQSRLYCEVLSGHCKLPGAEIMQEDIDKKRANIAKTYVKSLRHTIEVNYVSFMDELAKIIGVKPNLLKYWLTDPCLAYRLLFDGMAAYQFRLQGPHPWDGARDALLDMPRRTFENCRTRRTPETMKSTPINKILYFLQITRPF